MVLAVIASVATMSLRAERGNAAELNSLLEGYVSLERRFLKKSDVTKVGYKWIKRND